MFDVPSRVAVWDSGAREYPGAAPYHPSEPYPEYPFGADALGPENPIYRAVRQMLRVLDFDVARYGSPAWNPLGGMVSPGNTVILKPNFVISEHPLGQPGIDAAVVHGSVLRPLIDYVYIALEGRGRIIVADSPIKEVDFERILQLTGIAGVKDFYEGAGSTGVETLDFRDILVERSGAGFMIEARQLAGDPKGYTLFDLGLQSMFQGPDLNWERLRSTAVYYENVMEAFHGGGRHVYSLPNTLLEADVVISVAKLKTHRKGGITVSLKNAVGITNEKRGLPHHRMGSPATGGDTVPDGVRLDARLEDAFRDLMLSHPSGRIGLRLLGAPLRIAASRVVKPLFRRLAPAQPAFVEGDWYGNDTVWRMALDINRALLYAGRDGSLHDAPQRRYLCLVDGVIAGEGEGPLFPTPKPCGVLLMGLHPVTVDLAASRLMGFDWRKVPMLREAVARDWPLRPALPPEEIAVAGNVPGWVGPLAGTPPRFSFEPSAGWAGHIEL